MKIILDTDGTMTDFNNFIQTEAIPYFINKYSMEIVSPNSLEIQDIFDMDTFFANYYKCSNKEAKKYTKKALDEFWIHPRYLKYSLFYKFRLGLCQYVKEMIKEGHDVEIHTSRDKTTDNNAVGRIARGLTRLQYLLNGIHLSKEKYYFYKNDKDKVKNIIESKPDIVFEDKPEIIECLKNNGIKCVCVEGCHNTEVVNQNSVYKSNCYSYDDVLNGTNEVLGKKNFKYFRKSAKSDLFYDKISCVKNVILKYFEPIILNGENIISDDDKPYIYAPNHRSTLDPLVINSIVNKHIHWAALLRFFEGKDSIFNNSKDPFLCNLTAKTFKKLEYIPIERKKDNPNANNFSSIRDMVGYLQINKKIGIFPEGTTSRPENQDFGYFDPAFILMAIKTNASILPITTYWFKDENNKKRVVLNFGKPITVSGKTKEQIYDEYINIQQIQLDENKSVSELYKVDKNSKKTLLKSSKIYYN